MLSSQLSRKVPHGVESDGLDTRAAAPARGISHEEKRRRQNRRDIFSSLGILLLIALLGFCGYTAYRFTCVYTIIVSESDQKSAKKIISNINDFFVPITKGIDTLIISVFDRWGKKVFQTKDFETGWDVKI